MRLDLFVAAGLCFSCIESANPGGPLLDAAGGRADQPDSAPQLDATADGPARLTTCGGLSLSPTDLDFGSVAVGEVRRLALVLSNLGGAALPSLGLRIEGSSDFGVVIQGGADGLAAGANSQVLLQYRPSDVGSDQATLSVTCDDRVEPVTLRGNFFDGPCLRVLPASLDLVAAIGSTTEGTLSLATCGDEAVEVRRIQFEDADDAALAVLEVLGPSLPAVVRPGASPGAVEVQIAYGARRQGSTQAVLLIESNDAMTPVTRVAIGASAIEDRCPLAIARSEPAVVEVRGPVILDGADSRDPDGADVVRFEWAVTARPNGSTSEVVEALGPNPIRPNDGAVADNPQTSTAVFWPDVAGRFVIQLRVFSADGGVGPCGDDVPADATLVLDASLTTARIALTYMTDADVRLEAVPPVYSSQPDEALRCGPQNPDPSWPDGDACLHVEVPHTQTVTISGLSSTTDGPYEVRASVADPGAEILPIEATLVVFCNDVIAYRETITLPADGLEPVAIAHITSADGVPCAASAP
ncbi:MAG: choice-of-anchor D domain-containing protein [Myxococcales bacterium]|nr:choice-of-anchor D domain-containing protein [Myxococcales bacterium]